MKSGRKPGKTKGKCPPTTFGKNGKPISEAGFDYEGTLAEIQRQILMGHSKRDIIELIKTRNIPEWTPERLYEEAIDSFKGINSDDPNVKLGFTEAALKMLYQKMMEVGDFAGALSALKEFSKLNKLGSLGKDNPKVQGIRRYEGHEG